MRYGKWKAGRTGSTRALERAKRLVAAEELLAGAGGLVKHPETAAHALADEDE